MYKVEEAVQEVKKIYEEAKTRKYDEFVLDYDLRTFINKLLSDTTEYYENYYEDSRDVAYDEGKEEGYDDGYYDGEKQGNEDGQRELLERISEFVIKLKTDWEVLSKEEIREKLTEFICELDNEIN